MSEFSFIPQIGMRTGDCYLHGINSLDNILHEGVIEFVSSDYFVLRDKYLDKPCLVIREEYGFIEEDDFINY